MISREKITRKANKLRKKCGFNSAPIQVETVNDSINVTIRYEDLEDDLSGFLLIKKNKKTIVINENHHSNRQRFTLAHELGHLSLHVKENADETLFVDKTRYNRNIESSLGYDPKEIEANRFAALLLMPEELIREHLKEEEEVFDEFGDNIDTITTLAKKFEVSKAAITHRLSDLFLYK